MILRFSIFLFLSLSFLNTNIAQDNKSTKDLTCVANFLKRTGAMNLDDYNKFINNKQSVTHLGTKIDLDHKEVYLHFFNSGSFFIETTENKKTLFDGVWTSLNNNNFKVKAPSVINDDIFNFNSETGEMFTEHREKTKLIIPSEFISYFQNHFPIKINTKSPFVAMIKKNATLTNQGDLKLFNNLLKNRITNMYSDECKNGITYEMFLKYIRFSISENQKDDFVGTKQDSLSRIIFKTDIKSVKLFDETTDFSSFSEFKGVCILKDKKSNYIYGYHDAEFIGAGAIKKANGEFIFGIFDNNMISKFGFILFPNQNYFVGQLKNNEIKTYTYSQGPYSIEGLLCLKNGTRYNGEITNGVPNGQGKLESSTWFGNLKNFELNGIWEDGIFLNSIQRDIVQVEYSRDMSIYDDFHVKPKNTNSSTNVKSNKEPTKWASKFGEEVLSKIDRDKMGKEIGKLVKAGLSGKPGVAKGCVRCDGKGIVKICPICNKTGKKRCWKCNGNRYTQNGRTCLECSGTGIVTCDGCKGKIYNIKCTHNIFQFQN